VLSTVLDAQTRMKDQTDKRRKDVTFPVGSQVLLSTKNLTLKGGGPRKLMPRYIGPFKVEALIGKVAFRLGLPDHMKIHNVFHANLLQPYRSDGKRHPPAPELVEGELEYTVDSITAHREKLVGSAKGRQPRRTKVEFLTCWTGYGREHDSWEPGESLQENAALDVYLRGLIKKKMALPPGFMPDDSVQPVGTRKRARSQAEPAPTVTTVMEPEEVEEPPPQAALAPYKRAKRTRFQLTSLELQAQQPQLRKQPPSQKQKAAKPRKFRRR
jgi:hypothetical protein